MEPMDMGGEFFTAGYDLIGMIGELYLRKARPDVG
jgi:hypothetical protein